MLQSANTSVLGGDRGGVAVDGDRCDLTVVMGNTAHCTFVGISLDTRDQCRGRQIIHGREELRERATFVRILNLHTRHAGHWAVVKVVADGVLRLFRARAAAEIDDTAAAGAVGEFKAAKMCHEARLGPDGGELHERVIFQSAVGKGEAVKGEVAIRQAQFVMPTVDPKNVNGRRRRACCMRVRAMAWLLGW